MWLLREDLETFVLGPDGSSIPIRNLSNTNIPAHHYGDSLAPPPSDQLINQGFHTFQFPPQNIPLQSVQPRNRTSANLFLSGVAPPDITQTDTIINPTAVADFDAMNNEAWKELARQDRERRKRKHSEESEEQQEGKLE